MVALFFWGCVAVLCSSTSANSVNITQKVIDPNNPALNYLMNVEEDNLTDVWVMQDLGKFVHAIFS